MWYFFSFFLISRTNFIYEFQFYLKISSHTGQELEQRESWILGVLCFGWMVSLISCPSGWWENIQLYGELYGSGNLLPLWGREGGSLRVLRDIDDLSLVQLFLSMQPPTIKFFCAEPAISSSFLLICEQWIWCAGPRPLILREGTTYHFFCFFYKVYKPGGISPVYKKIWSKLYIFWRAFGNIKLTKALWG